VYPTLNAPSGTDDQNNDGLSTAMFKQGAPRFSTQKILGGFLTEIFPNVGKYFSDHHYA